jgi:transposase-like protein
LNEGTSQKAYIQGISTCSVDDLVKAKGMWDISTSQVNRLCEEIGVDRHFAATHKRYTDTYGAIWVDEFWYRNQIT